MEPTSRSYLIPSKLPMPFCRKTRISSAAKVPRRRKFLETLNCVPQGIRNENLSRVFFSLKSFSTMRGSQSFSTLEFLSKRPYFITGSVPGKRGYTCSLWTIFHYITVGSHAKFLRKEIGDPNIAPLVIRDYVENFFSCSDCVDHFRKMAARIGNGHSDPIEVRPSLSALTVLGQ